MHTVSTKEEVWLLHEKYRGVSSEEFLKDCARLREGEPLAYVIGFSDFLGTRISLSSRALIPRTETEHWTEELLKEIQVREQEQLHDVPLRVLDLFAGSGCVGTALLHHTNNTQVDFGEFDGALCGQIENTCIQNAINQERFRIFQTDVWSHISFDSYDYVLANPPYLSEKRREDIQNAVYVYEPHLALFGGESGLQHLAACIQGAPEHLARFGTLVCECDPWQEDAVDMLGQSAGFSVRTFKKDQYGLIRYVRMEGIEAKKENLSV